jgi:hypothetical protein
MLASSGTKQSMPQYTPASRRPAAPTRGVTAEATREVMDTFSKLMWREKMKDFEAQQKPRRAPATGAAAASADPSSRRAGPRSAGAGALLFGMNAQRPSHRAALPASAVSASVARVGLQPRDSSASKRRGADDRAPSPPSLSTTPSRNYAPQTPPSPSGRRR